MKGETYKGYILTDNDWQKVGTYHTFKTFKVFFANEQRNIKLLYKRDFEESFTGQFLKAGFETFGVSFKERNSPSFNPYPKPISPTTNWFGTSIMEPDTIFIKDDKEMVMSLQGVETPFNKKYEQLFDQGAIKYICIKNRGEKMYEDWTGNLPPKELITEFLK